jgi:integrase/recombinase XerD
LKKHYPMPAVHLNHLVLPQEARNRVQGADLSAGQEGGHYSQASPAKVLQLAPERSDMKKPVPLHLLCHSYAIDLLQSYTDLRYLQDRLGDNSIRTTEIYTHASTRNLQQIRSPFDDL